MSELTIGVLAALDQPTYRAICGLLPQLSAATLPPTFEELAQVVDSPATQVLVARDGDEVLAMLTLVLIRLPTARVAHIEDVVVDERARGHGVGGRLVQAALSIAADAGARHVDLTSRPERTDANRLYQSLGFEQRTTNAYRYPIR